MKTKDGPNLAGSATIGGGQGSSSAACPSNSQTLPREAQAFGELGWLDTYEDVPPAFTKKISESWRNRKVSIFPPDPSQGDSQLMLAVAALKKCNPHHYPNRGLFDAARDIVGLLPPDHADFRTLSNGPDEWYDGIGYPRKSLPIHLVAQTKLSGCVPFAELKEFYEEIAAKTKLATDAPNDKLSPPPIVAGNQGNVALSDALLRHGAGSSCSQYLVVLVHK